jgi:hypothetical protein
MTNLPEEKNPRELRASDGDRDKVASVLRDAAGDGRLSLEELDERLSAVYAAKTYADLEPITRDLPDMATAGPPSPSGHGSAYGFGGEPTSKTGIGILGGFARKGPWGVPRRFTSVAFWGGGEIDLREARFSEREVTIRAFAVMGGVHVIVPEDAEVHVSGIGIMGGFDHSSIGPGRPGGPRILIRGFAFWGGVGAERKPTDTELKRRKAERKRLKLQHRRDR